MLQAVTDVVHATQAAPPLSDDRITMLLTAVGVAVAAAALMLGALAVYLAYLAFIGKKEIIQKAEAAAKKAVEEYLERDENLQELDEPAVDLEAEEDKGGNEEHKLE